MKKLAIGFNTDTAENLKEQSQADALEEKSVPRKSLVDVYFSDRDMAWTYYNDKFDLHIGDIVYVEGKLEGKRGRVVNVSYSFKIKLSNYKRIVAVADTNVKGDFYITGSHIVTFDANALPFEKALSWYKANCSENEEIICGDEGKAFPLKNLKELDIMPKTAERGYDYYASNKVVYISLYKTHGKAIVKGSEIYEIEFELQGGKVSNLVCSCYCCGACKHEFAAMLQLNETLDKIEKYYSSNYSDYFAAVFKGDFLSFTVNGKTAGKITLGNN